MPSRCWSLGSWRAEYLTHLRTFPSCLLAWTSFSMTELVGSSYRRPRRETVERERRVEGLREVENRGSYFHTLFLTQFVSLCWRVCNVSPCLSPLPFSCLCQWPADCCIHAQELLWPRNERQEEKHRVFVNSSMKLISETNHSISCNNRGPCLLWWFDY